MTRTGVAASLRELVPTAERLERAYDREARIVALTLLERETAIRVLDDPPAGALAELRAVLLQEHVGRYATGSRKVSASPATRAAVCDPRRFRPLSSINLGRPRNELPA